MPRFSGEYDCKLDSKGRFRLPAALLKQLEATGKHLVVNRGIEKCLVLYTKADWDAQVAELEKLNQYVEKNRRFIRFFMRGSTETSPDSADRLLIPKRLKEHANIDKEIILFAYMNKIEIWAKEAYDNMLGDEPEDFSSLAEDVMGNIDNEWMSELWMSEYF